MRPTQHNPTTRRHQRTRLAVSITLAMAGAFSLPQLAQAQQQATSIQISAQPLSSALNELARQANLQLSTNPDLLVGKQAPAVAGQLTTAQALQQLLAGSGLEADINGPEVIIRKPVPYSRNDGAQSLPEVVVTAEADASGATENTGSYTTGITSTATRMNLSIRETPQSISVVTRQRMDDQNLTSITNVLEQTSGVTIARNSSERFNIYSRGSEITKYQFDGITTHVENQTQNMSQNLADMSIYDKIEVVRGATGLMTGAGNVSGMVNMVRKKPTKEFQASVEGSVGRWDDYRGQVDVSGPLIASGKLRGRFVAAKQDNDSFTDYRSQKRDAYYGVMEADITDSTTLRLGIDYNKYEANGGADSPLFYTDGQQTNFPRSTTVTSKHQNQALETTNYFFNIDQALANGWKLVMAGGYMDVDRKISNTAVMNQGGVTGVDRETGDFRAVRSAKQINPLSQKSLSINLQGPFSLFGREHQAIFGYEFSRYKSHWTSYGYGSTTANLSSIHEVPMLDEDLYSIQDFYIIQRGYYGALRLNPVDKLHVILGARVSDYKYDTAFIMPVFDYSDASGYKKKGEVTPYAGLVYDLTPEQSVYLSYTDIFTPNNVNDINGKVIEPQVGSNYEIGWKGEFYGGRLNANVALYRVKRDNATELAGRNASNVAYYRAIDGVETKGIDIELAGEVLPGWNISGSYSHSRSENANGVRMTAEHPLDTVKLWSTYNFSGDWQGLAIGGGARWSSKISSTPSYASFYYKATQNDVVVFDAMARYKINQNLSATLNISNLFDKKYYSGIGNLNMGFYGAPRNVRLGMRYDF